ncbi:MAG: putative lipid II flippase FtsW [Proteobacteria bacterium]|nr:putative lipid II flippase FtsW [Pseudomonadota bacterium]
MPQRHPPLEATGQSLRPGQALRIEAIRGRYDPVLAVIAILIAGFGIVMVGSSSIAISEGAHQGPFYYLIRHAVFVGCGLIGAVALMRTELKWLEQRGRFLLVLCFLLLAAVYLPGVGRTINGAKRWLNLGISNFQAVEAVKPMLIVWLSSYLVRYRDEVGRAWWPLLKPVGIASALVVMLLAQPDFGSASLILAVTGGMLLLGGASVWRLFGPVLVGLPVLGVVAMSQAYRVRRLTSFLNPWADPFKDGFQLSQALIAIGRGQWFGVGLGGSVQKLFYLPEANTDFILAVIAEELGFFGVLAVILLYAAFFARCMQLGFRAAAVGRHFAANCAFGIGLWFTLQALVSVGVNLGVLPTKGLTLPMISYGGSSVVASVAVIGLLLRISYEVDRAQRQMARAREGVVSPETASEPAAVPPSSARPVAVPARGAVRHTAPRDRVEPRIGEEA